MLSVLYQLGRLVGLTWIMTVASPFFWLMLWVMNRYYQKNEWDKASAFKLALASFMEAIPAGIFSMLLILLLGLSLKPGISLYLMAPASLMLSLIKPRFLCLSYGAGFVLFIGYLFNISIDGTGIVCLVAVLHLTEGLLILLGNSHATPGYHIQKNQMERYYQIWRLWPVPICLFLAAGAGEKVLTMPSWWPLLPLPSASSIGGLLPLTVTLTYSDYSSSLELLPKRRRRSGLLVIGYAVTLLLLSLIAARKSVLLLPVIIFMVGGHEAIIIGRKESSYEKPSPPD